MYAEGDQVMLNTANISLVGPGTRKLMPRWIGPFPVTQRVGSHACRLELPPSLPIHPVFHVSVLKPYHSDGRQQPVPPPPVLATDGVPEYEVEEIL